MSHFPRLALLLALALFATPAAADAPFAGTVVRLQGEATRISDGKTGELDLGQALQVGDELRTGAKARLKIRLVDGSELTLGENAVAVLERVTYDPLEKVGREKLDIREGAFEFTGGAIEKMQDRDVSIRGKIATMGVRGTRFWGGMVDDKRYGVLTLSGSVDVDNGMGKVTLAKGQGTFCDHTSPPTVPGKWKKPTVTLAKAAVAFDGKK